MMFEKKHEEAAELPICESESDFPGGETVRCTQPKGHKGRHRNSFFFRWE